MPEQGKPMENLVSRLEENYPRMPTADRFEAAAAIKKLRAAITPLAELPVGAELFITDECLDTVLYKNGGKCITARDIMSAREALGAVGPTGKTEE